MNTPISWTHFPLLLHGNPILPERLPNFVQPALQVQIISFRVSGKLLCAKLSALSCLATSTSHETIWACRHTLTESQLDLEGPIACALSAFPIWYFRKGSLHNTHAAPAVCVSSKFRVNVGLPTLRLWTKRAAYSLWAHKSVFQDGYSAFTTTFLALELLHKTQIPAGRLLQQDALPRWQLHVHYNNL